MKESAKGTRRSSSGRTKTSACREALRASYTVVPWYGRKSRFDELCPIGGGGNCAFHRMKASPSANAGRDFANKMQNVA